MHSRVEARFEQTDEEPQSVEGFVALDAVAGECAYAPADLKLKVSFPLWQKWCYALGIRLTEGMTQRGDTRVSSKLDGIWPIT